MTGSRLTLVGPDHAPVKHTLLAHLERSDAPEPHCGAAGRFVMIVANEEETEYQVCLVCRALKEKRAQVVPFKYRELVDTFDRPEATCARYVPFALQIQEPEDET